MFKFLGSSVASGIFLIVLATLLSLFFVSEDADVLALLQDEYILHVIKFSFFQAFLSTFLSIFFALFLSLALYRREFVGKRYLLALFNISFVLPVLIAVFGLVAIYGNSGIINSFFEDKLFNIYGLFGILLAHLFFNIPFATKIFYENLSLIDASQHKISAQLGLNALQKFLYLEFPILKQQLPSLVSLIFVLCFTSFAVILALGGAKYTTIEVAIYQAIKYDYDLPMAGFLSIIQIISCLLLSFIVQRFSKQIINKGFKDSNEVFFTDTKGLKFLDYTLIFASTLLVLPPLLAIFFQGLNATFFDNLFSRDLLNALKNSLLIATSSAFLSISFGILISLSSREFKMKDKAFIAYTLEMFGSIILIIPSVVISTGAFILLNPHVNVFENAFYFVVMINVFMALPFVIRSLSQAFFSIEQEYKYLSASLGIYGINRLRLVEFKALKKPILSAVGLSFILSFGDLSVIALFGSNDFKTLPLLLYEQMGSYQMQKAAVSALILLFISLISYIFIQNISTCRSENAKS
ncbi:MAG: thiamine/thiamine pyrophosphate ABC transporter permease [Campylobacteraceae bacterium]|nr:thiamine/thiamine pyrophosphate ABC transporter permease [Campylobacteraceae bacterium]